MKTLIIYGTRTGVTEDCAKELEKLIKGDNTLVNIKKSKPNLNDYDQIIIGTSIYWGTINSKIKEFCEGNSNILLSKSLAIYTCGLSDDKGALDVIEKGLGKELVEHAKTTSHFKGEARLNKLNLLFRFILKKVIESNGQKVSQFNINKDNIKEFANVLNK